MGSKRRIHTPGGSSKKNPTRSGSEKGREKFEEIPTHTLRIKGNLFPINNAFQFRLGGGGVGYWRCVFWLRVPIGVAVLVN